MSIVCTQILMIVAFLVFEIKLAFNFGQISLSNMSVVKNLNQMNRIGSKNPYK